MTYTLWTGKKDDSKDVEKIKVGEPAEVGGVTFTVNKVKETDKISSGNEFIDDATTSGKFVILDVTVKNDKDESITMDSSFFKIKTGGKEYEATSDGEVMMALGDAANDFFLKSINTGLEKDGQIVFEVGGDVDLSKAKVEAQTGFWGTETVEVSLNK